MEFSVHSSRLGGCLRTDWIDAETTHWFLCLASLYVIQPRLHKKEKEKIQEAKKKTTPKNKTNSQTPNLNPLPQRTKKTTKKKGILWFRSVSQKEYSLWIWNYPINKKHSPLTPNYVKPANTTIKKKKSGIFLTVCAEDLSITKQYKSRNNP